MKFLTIFAPILLGIISFLTSIKVTTNTNIYMRKIIPLLLFLLCASLATAKGQKLPLAGSPADSLYVFHFVAGDDMFYIPWKGNEQELAKLTEMIKTLHADILNGRIPVEVDGWCTSQPDRKANLHTAALRSNRVKSELILRAALTEQCFVTHNHAEAYGRQKEANGNRKEVVTVALRIPAKATAVAIKAKKAEDSQTAQSATQTGETTTPPAAVQETKQPVSETQPAVSTVTVAASPNTYRFAVRTNLLYDAFLLPTLGVEWRVNDRFGIKLDGSLSWWGNEHGKTQKMWLLNPEVRRYMGGTKRFYLGVSGNYGEYNIYRYMIAGIRSKDTGYQGKCWNAGITAGYQLFLSRSISLDFNIGLGYTRFDYDSFGMTDGVRVNKERNQSKNFWGPTQVGINLIWTIGGTRQNK